MSRKRWPSFLIYCFCCHYCYALIIVNDNHHLCYSLCLCLYNYCFHFCCYCYNYYKLLIFIWIPSLLNLLGVFRCLSLLIQKVVIIRFVIVLTLDHAIKYPLNFVLPVVWCTYWWHLRISIGCRQVAPVGSLTLSTVALAFFHTRVYYYYYCKLSGISVAWNAI